jgi:hypothetical protein
VATFKDVVQRAAKRLGLNSPSAVIASTDVAVLQLAELLNEEGLSLSSRYGWEVLTREVTFSTVATESQGTIASIISTNDTSTQEMRYIVNDTIFNRTQKWMLCGPLAPKTWQAQQALYFAGPFAQYRIRGGRLLMNPVPAAGDTCAFEYVSKRWISNAAGTSFYSSGVADTDVVLLDPDLLYLGLVWRWRAAKKLDFQKEEDTYNRAVIDAMTRDGTRPTLSLEGTDRVDNAVPTIQGGVGSGSSGSSGSGGYWSPPGW